MTWYTHSAVGANVIWIIPLLSTVDTNTILLLPVAALAALLPDIDAWGRGAKIHYIGGGILGGFKGMFKHRHFFHSFLAVAILFIVSNILFQYSPFLPIIITLSYLSHLLIDGLNKTGARYLFPHKKMFNIVPKFLRSPVKGAADQILFVVSIFGVIFFLLNYILLMQNDLGNIII